MHAAAGNFDGENWQKSSKNLAPSATKIFLHDPYTRRYQIKVSLKNGNLMENASKSVNQLNEQRVSMHVTYALMRTWKWHQCWNHPTFVRKESVQHSHHQPGVFCPSATLITKLNGQKYAHSINTLLPATTTHTLCSRVQSRLGGGSSPFLFRFAISTLCYPQPLSLKLVVFPSTLSSKA